MKPTTKQIKVIEFLEQQLSFWKKSNDISSPTHIGDIGEFSQFLDDVLSKDEIMFVELITHEIYERINEIEFFKPK
jgi:hypothetical protein